MSRFNWAILRLIGCIIIFCAFITIALINVTSEITNSINEDGLKSIVERVREGNKDNTIEGNLEKIDN